MEELEIQAEDIQEYSEQEQLQESVEQEVIQDSVHMKETDTEVQTSQDSAQDTETQAFNETEKTTESEQETETESDTEQETETETETDTEQETETEDALTIAQIQALVNAMNETSANTAVAETEDDSEYHQFVLEYLGNIHTSLIADIALNLCIGFAVFFLLGISLGRTLWDRMRG